MSSVVEICNAALGRVGGARISDLNLAVKEARVCKAAYPEARDATLVMHHWSVARRRRTLAAVSPGPEWGWRYKYLLPSDCLRELPLTEDGAEEGAEVKASREGRYLLTNQPPPLRLRYTARIENPQDMGPLLRAAISAELASRIVADLVGDEGDRRRIRAEAQFDIRKAISRDDTPGVPRQAERPEFLRTRTET
ncbi:MAG: hypothetical protein QNJ84_18965 [Alphaproteobacteria bacterium]|nr:hypothetical protein [Alphaproteobacteria bacterium]